MLLLFLCACTQDKQKTVVCWGDLLTAPHASNTIKGKVKILIGGDSSYFGVLEEELSNEYQIVNSPEPATNCLASLWLANLKNPGIGIPRISKKIYESQTNLR